MTEETAAAAATDEQATQVAPAESEQATQTDTSVQNTDAAPENAENTEGKEQEQTEPEGEESEAGPKRLTRNQRLQRKAARLATVVAQQADEIDRLKQQHEKSSKETEPKAADYPQGEYDPGYLSDLAAHKAASKIRTDMLEDKKQTAQSQRAEREQEAVEDFLERAELTKKAIPDYDQVVAAFDASGGRFAPHVVEEIRDSEKGPELAYHIAKTPGLAAELNALSPRDAAREIGRLEARVSLPQPKKQTKAPAPLAPLKGGASPSADLHSLAKGDDVSAYWEARKAQK